MRKLELRDKEVYHITGYVMMMNNLFNRNQKETGREREQEKEGEGEREENDRKKGRKGRRKRI